jgi:phage tail sheath protein FI
MANFSVSPGVTTSEIDNTFLTGQPVQAGAAIVGPTVKGPVEIPTLVTSYADYVNRFGDVLISGSNTYSYLTSISAYNYFNNGGTSLIVSRVVSGSYTPAQSTTVSNALTATPGTTASLSFDASTIITGSATGSFVCIRIELPGVNDFYVSPNSQDYNFFSNLSDTYYSSSGASTNANTDNYMAVVTSIINSPITDINSIGLSSSYNSGTNIFTIYASSPGVSLNGVNLYKNTFQGGAGTFIGTLSGGTPNISGNALVLETLSEGVIMNSSSSLASDGTLASGSKDNIRWEITNSNTSSGAFNVIVRRGDDKTNSKTILETWNNVNLDPNSSRFISRVIGDQVIEYNPATNQIDISAGSFTNQSRYIRVKTLNYLTPNYLNNSGNPVSAYTASIPLNGSGSFTGATGDVKAGANFYDAINASNTQGLVAANYDNMVNLLSNKDDYQFNVLSTPGLFDEYHTSTISTIVTNTQLRGDNLYVVDTVGYSGGVTDAISQASTRDTSYAATYWPWVRVIDPGTGKQVWIPASTLIPGVYAYNDKVAAPWFAPAGINRGGLSTVLKAKVKLTQGNRDELYENNINPIATFPKTGISVFGQKTLQKGASALDRVNVRRLMIELKSYITQIADTLVFEQNTITTRNNFLSRVNPYLEAIQQKQGLYAFRVIMDESNNTPDVIDRNQLIGQIYVQPSRTAEFIALDFILLPTGAQFPG